MSSKRKPEASSKAKPKQEPFDWTQFTLRIVIAAPVTRVFSAWTDDTIIIHWFTEIAKVEPKKNGAIHFEWLAGDKLDARFLAFEKNKRIMFVFGTKGEQVEVLLKKVTGGTLCELHQFGMSTSPRSKISMHMGCREGWTFFLTNLKSFLEHGIDLRSHTPTESYRQNYVNN
jgi:uncharacterized protein YndB with AHSA1/START domain